MYFLQTLWDVFGTALGWFRQVAVAFGSYLGLGEAIAKFLLASLILAMLAATPFSVSRRDRKSARNAASAVVDILSSIGK